MMLLILCACLIQVHDTQRLLERESQLLQQELSTLTTELTGWASKTQVCRTNQLGSATCMGPDPMCG